MPRVLAEVLRSINHVSLASEVVDSVWNAFSVDTLLGTGPKILILLKAVGVLDAVLKHLARLLAQGRMFLVIRLCPLLPFVLNKAHYVFDYKI